MTSRRAIKGVLHNFLGTFTSRYSDYDGYWLFGMLFAHTDALDIDLLHPDIAANEIAPISAAKRLATEKLAEQLQKAGLPNSCIREARLSITKLLDLRHGPVNGRVSPGHEFEFLVRAWSDLGKIYERKVLIFVAPHNSRVESRSKRATNI